MKKALVGAVAGLGFLAAIAAGWTLQTGDVRAESELKVYKSATCGCCGDWIDHMERLGFGIDAVNVGNIVEVKARYGIEPRLQSCHTAVSHEGYVFEGHIPGKMIQAFLDNPPKGAKGLSAPGMPMGSPGMEMGRFAPYNVLLVNEDGTISVYERVVSPDYE